MANASAVAGVQTGSVTVAASASGPDAAATSRRASPARAVSAGKRTSTRSLAGTSSLRPAPWVRVMLAGRTATSTSSASSAWFWITTGSSNRSPALRNRGADGRTISGRRAVSADSPTPKRLAPSVTTATMRYRVRLSGSVTSTAARPVASTATEATNSARALKSVRARMGGGVGAPPPGGMAPAMGAAIIGMGGGRPSAAMNLRATGASSGYPSTSGSGTPVRSSGLASTTLGLERAVSAPVPRSR